MPANRPLIKQLSFFIKPNDIYDYGNIQTDRIVCFFWGGPCFDIIKHHSLYIREYRNSSGSVVENNIHDCLENIKENIVLGYLKFVRIDAQNYKFICVFETSGTLGVSSDLQTIMDTEQWVEPFCVRITYDQCYPGFIPADDHNDSKLNPNIDPNQDDGAVNGIFLSHPDFDSVKDILYRHYRPGINYPIRSLEARARTARRTGESTPVSSMNRERAERYWNHVFREHGIDRKLSYVLKRTKSPIAIGVAVAPSSFE